MIIVRDSYNNLCVFNFGKHSYSIIKNNDKVVYFENVDGKYIMPITNFNLYDNQGNSLTSVNHHFFMSQLVNRVNVSLSKGYFRNDKELVDYLNNIKVNLENDSNLKNLFKGSLMGEINEDNFEKNKKEILKCLDQYKLDTFVDYDNVSIFNGSLDKNDNSSDIVSSSDVGVIANEFDFSANIPSIDNSESVDSADYFGSLGTENVVNDVVSNSMPNEQEVQNPFNFGPVQSDVVTEPEAGAQEVQNPFNFGPIQSDVVSEPETSAQKVQNPFSFGSIQSDVVAEPEASVQEVQNSFNFGPIQNDVVAEPEASAQEVQNPFNFGPIQSDVVTEPEVSVQEVQSAPIQGEGNSDVTLESNGLNNSVINDSDNVQFNDILSDISNSNDSGNVVDSQISYIDEVKDRIQSGNVSSNDDSSITFVPNESVQINNTVVDGNNSLPELDTVSNDSVSDVSSKKQGNNKNKVGVVVFMFILLALLVVAAYLLYNYVF